MYAVVIRSTIDMSRINEVVSGIGAVKARLSGMPGFAHAYWVEPHEGEGMMFSLWSDEAAATAGALPVGSSPTPGVTVVSAEVRRVIEQA